MTKAVQETLDQFEVYQHHVDEIKKQIRYWQVEMDFHYTEAYEVRKQMYPKGPGYRAVSPILHIHAYHILMARAADASVKMLKAMLADAQTQIIE